MIPISAHDRQIATTWWSALLSAVPNEVKGLWFGLTERLVDGCGVTTLYVAGTSEFNSDDTSGDWAAAIVWWPEDRYAPPLDLAVIAGADWRQALDYTTELVGEIVDPDELPPFLGGIGVGWDDGDARVLWTRP